MSTIYVACTKQRIDLARDAMRRVIKARHQIAFDWTEAIQREDEMSEEELARRAETSVRSVTDSDYLIFVTAKEMQSVGSIIEIGAMLGVGGEVIVVEEHGSFDHFFCCHPRVRKARTVDEAIELIRADNHHS